MNFIFFKVKFLFSIVLFYIFFIALNSCVNNTRPYQDRIEKREHYDVFTKTEIFDFECYLSAQESRAPLTSGQFYFKRNDNVLRLYVGLNKNPISFFPDPILYVKCDENIFKLPFVISEISKHDYLNSTETVVKDSSNSVSSSTSQYVKNEEVKFWVIVPAEIWQGIRASNEVLLRIYSGGRPSTFRLRQLDRLQKILD